MHRPDISIRFIRKHKMLVCWKSRRNRYQFLITSNINNAHVRPVVSWLCLKLAHVTKRLHNAQIAHAHINSEVDWENCCMDLILYFPTAYCKYEARGRVNRTLVMRVTCPSTVGIGFISTLDAYPRLNLITDEDRVSSIRPYRDTWSLFGL